MTVWDRTSACWEHTHPRAGKDSRAHAASAGRTIIGPVIHVHIIQLLGSHGFEIQIQSPTKPDRKSVVVICGGKNRASYISQIQDTISPVLIFFGESYSKRNLEFVLQSWSNPASRKLMPRNSRFPRIQCIIQKKSFLLGKGSGMIFLPVNLLLEILFKPESRNCSREQCGIMIKMKENLTALFIGILRIQNCGRAFQKSGGRKFSDTDWLWHIHEGSNKTRFQYWKNFQKFFIVNSCHCKDALVGI